MLITFLEIKEPLWSSGQCSWLQIQRSGFDFQRYHIFWEVVGLEQCPLSLVNTIEELLEKKSSGSGLENWDYGRRDSSRWPHGILYPQTLALASPISGGRSVGIVRSRTQATEFFKGIVHNEFVLAGQTVISTHCCDVLRRLRENMRSLRPELCRQ
jgi:hypothetical protein